ncbi:hypothetical protein FRC02_011806 [Tulasnella sp. 418]|nr:hypothetical protein FRC02_011806 [Tulasnella sp. 418]
MLSMYDAMGLFPPLNTPTLKTLRTQGFLPRFADQPPPLTSLELRPLQLPINELLEYITQFAETLRTIHIEEIGYAVAKGIFKAAIISDMKVLEKCWFKTGPGTLYSLLSNIRARNLNRLDVNLLESYGETSSLETPWHLHSPSQVSWTLNDKNSVDSLSTLLHCSPRISKLELEIPSYLSRSSVFEVSQHLVNMFLGNPPDGEDNNWSSGIRRHSYVNLEELRSQRALFFIP